MITAGSSGLAVSDGGSAAIRTFLIADLVASRTAVADAEQVSGVAVDQRLLEGDDVVDRLVEEAAAVDLALIGGPANRASSNSSSGTSPNRSVNARTRRSSWRSATVTSSRA